MEIVVGVADRNGVGDPVELVDGEASVVLFAVVKVVHFLNGLGGDLRRVRVDLVHEAQMIQPHAEAAYIREKRLQILFKLCLHGGHPGAEADDVRVAVFDDRLGDDATGIGIVQQNRLGRVLMHRLSDLEHLRNRAQCFEHSARARCFLTQRIVFQRDFFIQHPGIHPAHTNLGNHKVHPGDRLFQVALRTNTNRAAGFFQHALCEPGHNVQPFGVYIHHGDLTDGKLLGGLVNDSANEFRGVIASGSDNGDFDRFLH